MVLTVASIIPDVAGVPMTALENMAALILSQLDGIGNRGSSGFESSGLNAVFVISTQFERLGHGHAPHATHRQLVIELLTDVAMVLAINHVMPRIERSMQAWLLLGLDRWQTVTALPNWVHFGMALM